MRLLPRWELKHEKFDEFPKSHRCSREKSPGITSQKLLLSGTNQLFHLDREETVRVNPKVAPQRPTVSSGSYCMMASVFAGKTLSLLQF